MTTQLKTVPITVLERAIKRSTHADGASNETQMWDSAGSDCGYSGGYLKGIALRTTKATPSERCRERIAAMLRMDVHQLFESKPPFRAKLWKEEVRVEDPPPTPTVDEQEVEEIIERAQAVLDKHYQETKPANPTLESVVSGLENLAFEMVVAASTDTSLVRRSLLYKMVGNIGTSLSMVAEETDEPMPVAEV